MCVCAAFTAYTSVIMGRILMKRGGPRSIQLNSDIPVFHGISLGIIRASIEHNKNFPSLDEREKMGVSRNTL